MNAPVDYPVNFKEADDDGRVKFLDFTVQNARDLIDLIDDDKFEAFTTFLDEAQGDAGTDETRKPRYLILRIRP
jgi:hypothetical protein